MHAYTLLEDLILALPSVSSHHAPNSKLYTLFKQIARNEVEKLFSSYEQTEVTFRPFGGLVFPYHKMGAVDSLNLFDLDELIIFSFYWSNRKRYKRAVDIGANIGLHSIILSKCGYAVRAFEPDPHHFAKLEQNLRLNTCDNVQAYNSAISNKQGEMEFVRVLGNTTGSHLAGSKKNPYGELKRFPVKVEDIRTLISSADLIKMDAEGHEKEILLSTNQTHWSNTDAFVEIENKDNAEVIYHFFKNLKINLFSQKNNWNVVTHIDDMPTSYRDGSLFITCKDFMPWT